MKWLKRRKPSVNTDDTNGDLFGFNDIESQNSTVKTQKDTTSSPSKVLKKENKPTITSQEKNENLSAIILTKLARNKQTLIS